GCDAGHGCDWTGSLRGAIHTCDQLSLTARRVRVRRGDLAGCGLARTVQIHRMTPRMREESRDAPLANSLSERAVTAGQWRVGSMLVQAVLQFCVGVLLARFVPPGDFGVVALAVVVVGFATMLADLGLGPAIVQRRPLTDLHLRAVFMSSLIVVIRIRGALVISCT